MSCPNCGYNNYTEGETCFQCGYEPCIGPGTDIDRYDAPIPLPPTHALAETQSVTAWQKPCPVCGEQTFDGWDCVNSECTYGIPIKARKMTPRVMSPQEAASLRKQLGIH